MESKGAVIIMRTSVGFKQNTLKLIKELCAAGIRKQPNMSEYIIEAVKEKRERDFELLSEDHANV